MENAMTEISDKVQRVGDNEYCSEGPSDSSNSTIDCSPSMDSCPADAFAGRGQPKRKPDKSKICRITTDYSSENMRCVKCSKEFNNESQLENHIATCIRTQSPDGMNYSSNDEEENKNGERYRSLFHQDEDAVNNNQKIKDNQPRNIESEEEIDDHKSQNENSVNNTSELSLNEQIANSNLALEAINNTRITLAKLATAAAQDGVTEKSAQDLSLLQRALYNLQNQQILQMQLIKQLQDQLSIKKEEQSQNQPIFNETVRSPTCSESFVHHRNSSPISTGSKSLDEKFTNPKCDDQYDKESDSSRLESMKMDDKLDKPLSPALHSTDIASSVIQHNDSVPTSEPNTLEMLQRTANQVLSNASQGLLTNRLIDDYSKNDDGTESSNKHRCRYCGKLFGSDSALQIHLRSHTGERPFKCNICGNRFTTKGNLKVHFQRHQSRFPHIKMNPHPIPENLDKLYPPLLAQLGELSECPPAPTGPPSPFSTSSLLPRSTEASPIPPTVTPFDFTLGLPHPLISPISLLQDKPENLSWSKENLTSPSSLNDEVKMEICNDDDNSGDENSMQTNVDISKDKYNMYPLINGYKDDFRAEKSTKGESNENSEILPDEASARIKLSPTNSNFNDQHTDINEDEEKKDLRNDKLELLMGRKGNPLYPGESDIREEKSQNTPLLPFPGLRFPFPMNFPFLPGMNHPIFPGSLHLPPPPPRPIVIPPGCDPSKDPNVYNSLLPRPGSTDNSWEALIEVKKTSETMKLEELVKTIEYKLEPNQCVICHRVLSCKSALQMHYRTHTGERPFKCKICNHTFTTKGNLKTHMSVHRARPHIGMLHQCPVCHKKFGNGLVLQQHIKLHTGETTDLSPEQIAAAEIRDLSPTFPGFPPQLFPPGMPHPLHNPLRGFPPFPFPMRYPMSQNMMVGQTKSDEDNKSTEDSNKKMKSELKSNEEQKEAEDLSVKLREEKISSLSPRRSISPSPSDFSDPGMHEQHLEPSTNFFDRSHNQSVSPTMSNTSQESPSPLNLISRSTNPSFWSPFGHFPQPLTSTSLASTSMPPGFSPLYVPNIPGRGNTTCKICYKTLACQSALEIHYRSHTKERPFKCTYCDRGFTTKGNMKQHLLTHKVRTSTESKSEDMDLKSPSDITSSPHSSPLSNLPPLSSPMSSIVSQSSQRPGDDFLFSNSNAQNAYLDSMKTPATSCPQDSNLKHIPQISQNISTPTAVDIATNSQANLKRETGTDFNLPISKRYQSIEDNQKISVGHLESENLPDKLPLLPPGAGSGRLNTTPSSLQVQVS